jgi:PAS domain S-box
MIKKIIFFVIITLIYLNPFVPISLKGILGLLFIIVGSAENSVKGSLFAAFFLNLLMAVNYVFQINMDMHYGAVHIVIAISMYFFIAFYLGRSAEKLQKKNQDLRTEIEMRRYAEKILKENLFLMESMIGTMPTPVCFKDLEFRYTGCNAAYEEYFEIKERDLIGKQCFDVFDSDVAQHCNKIDLDLMEHKVVQVRESGFISKDGQQKFFIYTKALHTDESGNPCGIICVVLDITSQKERERLMESIEEEKHLLEEEKQIVDEIQRYDRLKTEFFSNISHELRTPLNVIFCAVQMMEMNLDKTEAHLSRDFVRKNVMTIRQNSMRLLRLVNNLIDITKIDAQAFEINLHNRDVAYVIREIVMSVADYVTTKGLNLVFHSEISEKIMAFDEEKLERIILNLLSNAIKFSPKGENIYVTLLEANSNIRILVKDRGIGIPPDRQQAIFQRFYQISPVNTRLQEGSGIGLNLVKSLVEMHNGQISLESECGSGTTFIIDLPDVLVQEPAEEQRTFKDRQTRIERIQLEFSDIYQINDWKTG